MKSKEFTRPSVAKFYGILGLLSYYFLSLPVFRSVFFSGGAKILDVYEFGSTGEVTDAFSFFTRFTLFIPALLNDYLFRFFDFSDLNLLVLVIFTPIVYRYFAYSRNYTEFLLLLFLFLPAPLLFLSSFNKEFLLVLALFFSYGYSSNHNIRFNHLWFFLYAFFMRGYLMFVPVILSFKRIRILSLVSVLILSAGFHVPVLGDVFQRLFNRRLADKGYVANSEIIQNTYVDNFGSMLQMFLEVFPQIFLPVFYGLSLKSIFFQIYIGLLLILCIYFRNIYSNLFLALMFFYLILDPDLGAYFRHLSSFFILFPLLLNFGVRNQKA